jgi:hypothetical protein
MNSSVILERSEGSMHVAGSTQLFAWSRNPTPWSESLTTRSRIEVSELSDTRRFRQSFEYWLAQAAVEPKFFDIKTLRRYAQCN